MAKSHLKLVAPATANRTVQPVPPGRRPNAELRSREHLTEAEIERLIDAAKGNRHGHRDATMLLVAFRHGLRAAEAPATTDSQRGERAILNIADGPKLRHCWRLG
jgi:integrase